MKRALVLSALLVLPTAPLAAQTITFTPRVGAYIPLRDLTAGIDPVTGLGQTQRAETKFTIGGRIGVWFNSAFGFEGVTDYNKGGVTTYLAGNRVSPTLGSHFLGATGRAMFKLRAPGNNVALILSAGAGLVDRGGQFINGINPPSTQYTGRTDFAPAGGIGLQVRLTKTVAARLDVDAYVYNAQYFNSTFGLTSQLRQTDLVITFGLSEPFKNYGLPRE